jgi:hypothetical protein
MIDEAVMEAEGQVKEALITIPFSDTFVYSNVSSFSASVMDIRISFGEALPDGKAYARVGIVMPAEHAAQLYINLFQQLAFFEQNFGPIRHPQWRKIYDKTMKAQAEHKANEQSKEPTENNPNKE